MLRVVSVPGSVYPAATAEGEHGEVNVKVLKAELASLHAALAVMPAIHTCRAPVENVVAKVKATLHAQKFIG